MAVWKSVLVDIAICIYGTHSYSFVSVRVLAGNTNRKQNSYNKDDIECGWVQKLTTAQTVSLGTNLI